MPRPERPLDPDAGVVQRFAWELRELRRRAGNPGYQELAQRAHYSVSTLAQAAQGEVLPSLAVTLAYIQACGADASDWEARWRAAADEVGASSGLGTGGDEPSSGRAPYVGLAAFQVADSEWFFGRDRLVAELVARVGQRRFVGVFGPSGSGKSSLLRAGLVPALDERPVTVFTPGAQPLDECAVHIARLAGESACSVRAELASDPMNLHLLVRQAMVERPAEEDLILVVDQFEEVFTLCSDREQRDWFIEALVAAAAAASSRTRVVVGVRSDFYSHCAHQVDLVDALRDGQVMVGPMSPEELRRAITGPAAHAGCRVETALVSRLVADATGQPAVLPLVSHALLQTWLRRHGTTLTLTAYENAGGIAHALAQTAEATYGSLDAHQQGLARRLFQRLTALGDGTEDTRRRISHDELDPDDPDNPATAIVLNALVGARLITLDHDGIQLAHEALIRHWPRLRDWLTDDRDGLRIHRQLTEATHTWQALDHDPGALYRGTRLARTNEWINTTPAPDLTTREREFLDASNAAQAAEQAMAQRRSRRQRQLIGLLTVLLLLTSGTAVYAVNAQNTANRQRNLAVIDDAVNQIAVLASTGNHTNRQLAFALSLAAYRLDANPRTRGSLISTRPSLELDGLMAFSPNGRTMAYTSIGASIALVDMTQPDQVMTQLPSIRSTSVPTSVRYVPNTNTLMITGVDRGDGSVDAARHTILFDIEHRRHLATLNGAPTHSQSLTPDGHTVALVSGPWAQSVQLVDLTDPRHPVEIATVDHTSGVMAAVFSPNGRTLVTTDNEQAHIWDVSSPGQPAKVATLADTGAVLDPIFSPDGNTMITTGGDGVVRLWDVTDPHQPAVAAFLFTYADTPPAVLSPNGKMLVTFGADNRIVLWDVTDIRHPTETATLTGSTNAAPHAALFSPDGRTLANFSANNTILLWDLSNPQQPIEKAELTHPTGPVIAATFSPDNQVLATTINEHSLYARLWETDADRIAAAACKNPTLPTITQAEWNRFFPGLPHQPRCH
jgi:hypothetical protein